MTRLLLTSPHEKTVCADRDERGGVLLTTVDEQQVYLTREMFAVLIAWDGLGSEGSSALDSAIDARLDVRDAAQRQAQASAPYWEDRTIWFWQTDRYLREGWTINQRGVASWWRDWLPALESAIWPVAVARFDPRTGEMLREWIDPSPRQAPTAERDARA